jgi:hypothetical protein
VRATTKVELLAPLAEPDLVPEADPLGEQADSARAAATPATTTVEHKRRARGRTEGMRAAMC